jgi:hypothetical protein
MTRNGELLALAQRLADAFPPHVVEVVLTGSVSRGVADKLSDIEMPVPTTKRLAARVETLTVDGTSWRNGSKKRSRASGSRPARGFSTDQRSGHVRARPLWKGRV